MASIVTGIIGGIQGASAAHNAANAVQQGQQNAIGTMQGGVNTANSLISNNADQAAGFVNDAANYGQGLIAGATTGAQQGMTSAVNGAQTGMTSAVNGAQTGMQPYISAGADATGRLSDLAGQQFSFNQDDPSYQWRLQQGQQALERSNAARGSTMGGAAAKSLARYGQGMASTEYQNAFNRFNTNRQTTGGMLSDLASRGLGASEYSGNAGMTGAQYNGNAGMQGAEYSGNAGMAGANAQSALGMSAAEYGGNAKMSSAAQQSGNTMAGSQYVGNAQMGQGQAKAAGDMGAANAWNGMLSAIGNGANSAMFGGFGGGDGFSLQGALSGMPRYPRR